MRLIDADALLEFAENRYWKTLIPGDIINAPTVDAKPVVHGRWIHTVIEDDWGGTFHKWTCTNCDFSTGHNPNGTNYCPNCGADMRGHAE